MAARAKTSEPAAEKTLSAADLRKLHKEGGGRPVERFDLPGLGVVCLRALSGDERDAFEIAQLESRDRRGEGKEFIGLRARTAAAHLSDADGKRIVSLDDAAWIGELDSAILDRLFERCRALSRLTAADVEELAGN